MHLQTHKRTSTHPPPPPPRKERKGAGAIRPCWRGQGRTLRSRDRVDWGPLRATKPPREVSGQAGGRGKPLINGLRERNDPKAQNKQDDGDGGGGGDSFARSLARFLLYVRRPRVEGDDPPNLSILISGGKETNRDSLSKCDRNGKSPAQSLASPSRGARGVLRSGEVLHALPSRLSCS